jgi:hypothetical protein
LLMASTSSGVIAGLGMAKNIESSSLQDDIFPLPARGR